MSDHAPQDAGGSSSAASHSRQDSTVEFLRTIADHERDQQGDRGTNDDAPPARKRPRAQPEQPPRQGQAPTPAAAPEQAQARRHRRDFSSLGRVDPSVFADVTPDELDRWLGEVCDDQANQANQPMTQPGQQQPRVAPAAPPRQRPAQGSEGEEFLYKRDASKPAAVTASPRSPRKPSSLESFSSRVAGIRRRLDARAASRADAASADPKKNGSSSSSSSSMGGPGPGAAASRHKKSDSSSAHSSSSSSSSGGSRMEAIKELLRSEMGRPSLGLGTIEPIPLRQAIAGAAAVAGVAGADEDDIYQPTPLAEEQEAMIRRQTHQKQSSILASLSPQKLSPPCPQRAGLALSTLGNTAPAPPDGFGANARNSNNYEPLPFIKSPKMSGFAPHPPSGGTTTALGLDALAKTAYDRIQSDAQHEAKEQPPTPQPQDSAFVAQYYAAVMGGAPAPPPPQHHQLREGLASQPPFLPHQQTQPAQPAAAPGFSHLPSSLAEVMTHPGRGQQLAAEAAAARHPSSGMFPPPPQQQRHPPLPLQLPPHAGATSGPGRPGMDAYATYLEKAAAAEKKAGPGVVPVAPPGPLHPPPPPIVVAGRHHPPHHPPVVPGYPPLLPPPPPPRPHPQPRPPAIPAVHPAILAADEILGHLQDCMEQSQESQQAIHDWDRNMGLRRSHSKTMRASSRSRKKLRDMREKMLAERGGSGGGGGGAEGLGLAGAAAAAGAGAAAAFAGMPPAALPPPHAYGGVVGAPPLPPSASAAPLTPYQLYLKEQRAKSTA